MKKASFIIFILIYIVFNINNVKAQKRFIELNGNFATYKQKNNIEFKTLEQDIKVSNIFAGYNYNIAGDFYLGGMLGYTSMNADDKHNKANLFTITPKLTYFQTLSFKFYWTPNFYITYGYGETKLEGNVGKIIKNNIRIGMNLLSFDYIVNRSLSVNLTFITPYYNILKYNYQKTDNTNFTAKNFVYLGGQLGVKFYL